MRLSHNEGGVTVLAGWLGPSGGLLNATLQSSFRCFAKQEAGWRTRWRKRKKVEPLRRKTKKRARRRVRDMRQAEGQYAGASHCELG